MQVAIYAGPGAKQRLTARRIKQVIAGMRPLLRQEKYGEALEVAAVDIGIALAGGTLPSAGGGDGSGSAWGFILPILIFIGIVVAIEAIIKSGYVSNSALVISLRRHSFRSHVALPRKLYRAIISCQECSNAAWLLSDVQMR